MGLFYKFIWHVILISVLKDTSRTRIIFLLGDEKIIGVARSLGIIFEEV